MSPPQAVLFDFSTTLFHLDTGERLLGPVLTQLDCPLSRDEEAALRTSLGAMVAGGGWRQALHPHLWPAGVADAWSRRHVDPAVHRTAYTWLLRTAELPRRELPTLLYRRLIDPDAWRPYPDTAAALHAARAAGLRVGVVSNIAWDIRPVFAAHGLAGHVDATVLSFEVGAAKPDPRIFRTACDRLGVPPEHTVMIGDDPREDGGICSAAGRYSEVPRRTPEQRCDGLLTALAAAGVRGEP
ncbi:MAG: HAD-IA family hydrolase [Pseudonocardiaceae bacterium]